MWWPLQDNFVKQNEQCMLSKRRQVWCVNTMVGMECWCFSCKVVSLASAQEKKKEAIHDLVFERVLNRHSSYSPSNTSSVCWFNDVSASNQSSWADNKDSLLLVRLSISMFRLLALKLKSSEKWENWLQFCWRVSVPALAHVHQYTHAYRTWWDYHQLLFSLGKSKNRGRDPIFYFQLDLYFYQASQTTNPLT